MQKQREMLESEERYVQVAVNFAVGRAKYVVSGGKRALEGGVDGVLTIPL